MSNCNFTVVIDENQCIGDSLDVINGNFESLDTTVCSLSTDTVASIQSFTPALTSTQNTVANLSGYFIGQINTILAALSSLDPTNATTLQAGFIGLSSLELP